MLPRKTRNNKSSGFTLIELLIVIVLIGILSAFFINASVINIKRGRDAKRKSDLESIRTTLETYRADCNKYPASLASPLKGDNSTTNCSSSNIYLSVVPTDPSNGRLYAYTQTSNTTYNICASLEAGSMTVNGCGSCGSGTCNYQVANP